MIRALTIFNQENLHRALYDDEVMDELVTTTQALVAGLYLQEACTPNDTNTDVDMPAAVNCGKCGDVTMYSAPLLMPNQPFDKICISRDCISKAIFTMAARSKYAPHECSTNADSDEE